MPLPIPAYTVVLGTSYQTQVPVVLAQNCQATIEWDFVDASGNPVPLEGKIIQFNAWQSADGGQTIVPLFKHSTGSGGSGIVIVGSGDNGVQVSFTQADTASLTNEWTRYDITSIDDEQVIASGPLAITPAYQ